MSCRTDDKAALRKQMRDMRDAMATDEHAGQSCAICKRLLALPQVRSAEVLACYVPFGSEVDLGPLFAALAENETAEATAPWERHHRDFSALTVGEAPGTRKAPRIAVPITLTGRRLAFVEMPARQLCSRDSLPRCLREPARPLEEVPPELVGLVISPQAIDAAILPGLAFDSAGARLGYGGGYYDSWLAGFDSKLPHLIGACFTCQLLPYGTIPQEPHDIRADVAVTPAGINERWATINGDETDNLRTNSYPNTRLKPEPTTD